MSRQLHWMMKGHLHNGEPNLDVLGAGSYCGPKDHRIGVYRIPAEVVLREPYNVVAQCESASSASFNVLSIIRLSRLGSGLI